MSQNFTIFKNKLLIYKWLLGGVILFCCNACGTNKTLFQNKQGTTMLRFEVEAVQEPVIRQGDKITVSIYGHEELSVGSVNSSFSSNEATGRWLLVDKTGEVNLPKVGRIKLEGYNIKEANIVLEQLYAAHINDPIINVKILSHYVTVLGEVNAKGRYRIDNEKVTLIQLLGMAEGLTKYAKAEEVKIIRTENGKANEVNVDLTDFSTLQNQNFIIQPDDLIYIPPIKGKRFDEITEKALPIASILTSIAVLFSVFLQ